MKMPIKIKTVQPADIRINSVYRIRIGDDFLLVVLLDVLPEGFRVRMLNDANDTRTADKLYYAFSVDTTVPM